MNIILIGFKSAGKTTFGKVLAAEFKRDFIDIDSKIAEIYRQKYGEELTAQQVYLKLGDADYRVLEKEAVLLLGAKKDSIIATGGGTVCDQDNVKVLGANGKFVYLNVAKEVVQKRIAEDVSLSFLDAKHPAKNFDQAFTGRQKIYREVADLVIDPENIIVEEMVEIVKRVFYGK